MQSDTVSLYWLQMGGCGGDSISFLNAEKPDFVRLLKELKVDLLWHPSLSTQGPATRERLVDDLLARRRPLDILCVEGAVIRGPVRTGMYDAPGGNPKKDLAVALARRARHVVALGTCASFGGFGVDEYIQATGLQFCRRAAGGLLGRDFRSTAGGRVINLAGCPCHPEVLAGTIAALAGGVELELDQYQRPLAWYGMLVHQGCTRNEYHEYRVEERDFGQKGCLFFHKGCHGPLAHGTCNRILWNGHSSKTRAGVPCFGCTSPDFPPPYPFFATRNIEGVPLELPDGINRARYLVYKEMAAVAAPARLKKRETAV